MGINFNGDISKILGQQNDAHVKPAGRFEADNIDIGGLLNGFKKDGGNSRPLDSKDLSEIVDEMNAKYPSREELDKNGDGFISSDEMSEYAEEQRQKQLAKSAKEAWAKAPEGLTDLEKLAWLIENSDTFKPKTPENKVIRPVIIYGKDGKPANCDLEAKPLPCSIYDLDAPKYL